MSDREIDRVIRGLDASFGAALARDDEDAARDLARSLVQDLDLFGAIRRWGGAVLRLAGGASAPIDEVGLDFLSGGRGSILVPKSAAVVAESGDAPPPVSSGEVLAVRLREWARGGRTVAVEGFSGERWTGLIARVAPDHLELSTPTGSLAVAFGAVTSIRLCREG